MIYAITRRSALAATMLALGGCMHGSTTTPLSPAARYVAMGSSFAAGPGITTPADAPATRCGRSHDNYAHQLARKRGLTLVDVTCSGATTAHLLGPWDELAPQLDAVTADTALVTVTIGGNDVNYVGNLMNASSDSSIQPAGDDAWKRLAGSFDRIAAEVRRRAPNARLVFVDYVTLLPQGAPCPATPVSAEEAATLRAMSQRLEAETAAAANRAGADLIRASALSREHDPCAAEAWANGFVVAKGAAPYHPNLAGMTGIAEALDARLPR
jgi:lysophospholipase L1-like esterase